MCFYAMHPYPLHYVCVGCRLSFKHHPWPARSHVCPDCRGQLICAGHDFAAPRRADTNAWSVVAAVLAEGLRYDERPGCGCSRLPSFRPRTKAQVRARRRAAERLSLPLSVTLARRDPFTPEPRDEGTASTAR
ncbi:hypothetical protein [Streptacidiphilus sp. EB129]|uniref:hypothetical protein n=1 Tax=Streptacidiphilus sp. EB129 TaxID=3156262 RepID=UPI0035136EB3